MSQYYCQLDHLSILALAGNKATSFLQSQVTSDILSLKPSQGIPTLLCNRKGQVICELYIRLLEDHWQIILDTKLVPKLQRQWHPLLRLSRLTLSDPLVDTPIYLLSQAYGSCIPVVATQTAGHQLLPIQADILKTQGFTEKDMNLNMIKIQQKIASINESMSEKYTPQLLGYTQHDLIDFKKGCYLGQEIIARIQFKSTKQYWLELANIDQSADIDHNSRLQYEQKTIGQIIAYVPYHHHWLVLVSITKNVPIEAIELQHTSYRLKPCL